MIVAQEQELNVELGYLVGVGRMHLQSLYGEAVVTPDILPQPALPRVNVTLRTQGSVRGSMSGHGQTLGEQLLDAVYRASRDTRFSSSIVKSDLKEITVEVWLQTSAELIPCEKREMESAIQLGVDGVEVELGSAFAYYKPSVALTSQYKTTHALFAALCKKAKLPAEAWKSPDCQLRKTSWVHVCETADRKVVKLNALRSIRPLAPTAESMIEWVQESAAYLQANQYSDGSFCYQYRPFANSAKSGDANPVRASGCAYAMAAVASTEHSGNEEIKKCADLAISAILGRLIHLEGGGAYVADNLTEPFGGKLGTTALLLLALLTPKLRVKYEHVIEALLIGIKSTQSDSGLFECSFGNRRETDSQINFFPGQALLALVLRAEAGDEISRDCYRKAFVPHRDHFRKAPATAFVGWQADVWARAALLDANQEYAEFVFEQIDWLLQFQIECDHTRPESGGFTRNGKEPGYSTVVYVEAIARAADLAYRLGDGRWFRYRDAFRSGMQFCSRLRLTREQSIFFPHPSRAIGGVATTLSDFEVRSDFVQHLITLALATLERPILLDM